MTETWKNIPGFDGYQASIDGRIRSVDRLVRCKNGFKTSRGKILSQFHVRSTGYLQVDLSGKRQSVHRLVALTWCQNFFEGAWVDHLNGNRSDNCASNLEWVTPSENASRGFASGRKNPFLGRHSGEHPTSKPVVSKCLKTGTITTYASAMDAVRAGFDSGSISRCCAGKIAHHKGHVWQRGVKWTGPAMEKDAA